MSEEAKSSEVAVQEAQQLLQEQNKKKIDACMNEINQVLEKHGCMIDVAMVVTAQGNRPIVNIIPKQEQ